MKYLFTLLLSLLLAASVPAAQTCAAASDISGAVSDAVPDPIPENADSWLLPETDASAEVLTKSAIDADLQSFLLDFLSEYHANEARKQTDSELFRFFLIALFSVWACRAITHRRYR